MQHEDIKRDFLSYTLKNGRSRWVSNEADWMAMKSGIDADQIIRVLGDGSGGRTPDARSSHANVGKR